MISTLRKIILPITLLFSLAFILFLINQVSGIYLMLADFNPVLAKVVLALLIVVFTALALSPLAIYMKLPKPLVRPENDNELATYKLSLVKRLKNNPSLKQSGITCRNIGDLPTAIAHLDNEADKEIKSTSSTIFLTTAISQNGKLDALTIFLTQMRMVWRIAHIYYQRPSVRELAYLYGNVGTASFLATHIEDIDISKNLEPVIASIAKSASGRSIPFVGPTATLVLDSLLEGTTNTFLSLRVGILAKKYCNQLTLTSQKEVKTSAFRESAVLLKQIALESSGTIISAIVKASKKAGIDTIKSGLSGIGNTGKKVKNTLLDLSKKANLIKEKETVA